MGIRRLVIDGEVVDWVHVVSKDIGFPELRKILVPVPGSDGDLDLTTALTNGIPVFANRAVSFTCTVLPTDESPGLWDLQRIVGVAWHGRRLKVTTDDEPTSYWDGRATVSMWTEVEDQVSWSLMLDAYPYRIAVDAQTQTGTATASGATVTLAVGDMPVMPTVTGPAGVVVADALGQSWALDGTTRTYPGLIVGPGDTMLTLTGAGDVSFEWHDGWM